ncbi:hypothetical protein [Archangium minus]
MRVSPDGEIHYRFVLEQIDLLVKGGTPQKDAEALRAELSPLPGLRGEGRVGAQGRSNHFQMALPADLSSALSQSLQHMLKSLAGMGTFLPPDPVGLGARWEHHTQGGPQTPDVTTTVELKSLEKNQLGMRLELLAPASTSAPRTQIRGQGGCLMRVDRLWPLQYELELDTHSRIHSQDEGPPRRLEITTHLRMQLRELSFTSPLLRASARSY